MSTKTLDTLNRTLAALLQLRDGPTWDGDLISKSSRDYLVKDGYVGRLRGFNFLTPKGVEVLIDLRYLNP